MSIAPTLEKYFLLRPATKREANVVAFKLPVLVHPGWLDHGWSTKEPHTRALLLGLSLARERPALVRIHCDDAPEVRPLSKNLNFQTCRSLAGTPSTGLLRCTVNAAETLL
jgi:hypothetical protein